MKSRLKSYRALAGQRIAQAFLQDRRLLYYLVLLIASFVFDVAQLLLGAQDGVINGYSLIILMIVPPLEMFFVSRARSLRTGKSMRQWGMMFLVAFALFAFATFFALTGYIGLIFSANSVVLENGALTLTLPVDAETTEVLSFTMEEVKAFAGMILACLYYCFMGLSLRQMGKMLDCEEIRRGMFLPAAVISLLMAADSLVDLVRGLFSLTAFTPADGCGLAGVLCTIAAHGVIALLFLCARQEWRLQDHLA